jgi:hypothetical protein
MPSFVVSFRATVPATGQQITGHTEITATSRDEAQAEGEAIAAAINRG